LTVLFCETTTDEVTPEVTEKTDATSFACNKAFIPPLKANEKDTGGQAIDSASIETAGTSEPVVEKRPSGFATS